MFILKLLMNSEIMGYLLVVLHAYIQTPKSIYRNNELTSKLRRIENVQIMIVDYSKFINSLREKNNKELRVIENLRFRRDLFVFFNLLKIIRLASSLKDIKDKVVSLELVKAYPIKNFVGK